MSGEEDVGLILVLSMFPVHDGATYYIYIYMCHITFTFFDRTVAGRLYASICICVQVLKYVWAMLVARCLLHV